MNHLGENKHYQVLRPEDCDQEICFGEGFEDDDDSGGSSDAGDDDDNDDDELLGEGTVFYDTLMRRDPPPKTRIVFWRAAPYSTGFPH